MADRQLTLEEVFALPEPAIQTYLQSKNCPSQGFWPDRISTTIYYDNDGWLTNDDQQVVEHPNFTTTAELTEEEIIRKVQDQGLAVTVLMTRFDLIRQLLLKEDVAGQLFAFGSNYYGQLGLGHDEERYTPTQALIGQKVKAVSAGDGHTMVITEDGQLFTFGWNNKGQLGLGHNDNKNTPALVERISGKVKAVSAGGFHTMVITEDGQLLAFGGNRNGQLGLDDNDARNTPTPVPIPGKVKAISAGSYHTMVITEDGRLYAFEDNNVGQLGLGHNDDKNTPIQVPIAGKVKAVSAGVGHTMVITENGRLFAFGWNNRGQLGLGDNDNKNTPTLVERIPGRVKAVSAGVWYTMVITEDGQLLAFGFNGFGELGLGDYTKRNIPTLVERIPGKVKAVSAGDDHTMVVTEDGRLFAFGGNNDGQLGLGHHTKRNIPTQVERIPGKVKAVSAGENHTMVIAEW